MSSNRPLISLAAAALALTTSIFVASAHACSCTFTPTVPEAKAAAEALFTGRVLEITVSQDLFGYPAKRVVLLVDAVWKGDLKDQVVVHTGVDDGVCGNHYELGFEFLVYADDYDSGEGVFFFTHSCGRTALAENNPDFRELGPPLAVKARSVSWGGVKQIWR